MKEQRQKIIYYTDELNDEFSEAVITPRVIDGNWRYIRDGFWGRMAHFFAYRVVANILGRIYLKCKFSHRVVGREALPKGKGEGYFIYGNHTQPVGDALIPSMLSFPRHTYVIVHPANVSMPFLGRINPYLGALPLPDDMAAYKNFIAAVKKRAEDGNAVCIYPEAHIWPYCTRIRPFTDKSFVYPIKLGLPVYCFTNTYQKHKKRVRIVTYVDGPFYPNDELPPHMRKAALRDEVFAAMEKRAGNSDIDVIKYVRSNDNDKHTVCGE